MKTRTRPPTHHLAATLALPLAALLGACGGGADRALPSGPAAAITPVDHQPAVTDPQPAPEAISGTAAAQPTPTTVPTTTPAGSGEVPAVAVVSPGLITDLDQLDAELAELDAQLAEVDRDLATPEGDF